MSGVGEAALYSGVMKKGDGERDGILTVGESVDPDQKSDGARADDTYETIVYRARPVRISNGWMRKSWGEERAFRKDLRESVFTVFTVSEMQCSRDISPREIVREDHRLTPVHDTLGASS